MYKIFYKLYYAAQHTKPFNNNKDVFVLSCAKEMQDNLYIIYLELQNNCRKWRFILSILITR